MTEDDEHKDVHFAATLDLKMDNIEGDGFILDIGGGGEGIIGQLEERRVIAIDKRRDELEEADLGDYLRVVMDATDLQFLDNSFPHVTAFFSMMYMDEDVKQAVFKEIYRVLSPGGNFLLWDLTVPQPTDESKSVYAVMLKIHLPNKIVETGYGCPWEKRKQDVNTFKNLGTKLGFKLLDENVGEHTFFLRWRK